jgi:hypothetical protein
MGEGGSTSTFPSTVGVDSSRGNTAIEFEVFGTSAGSTIFGSAGSLAAVMGGATGAGERLEK